MCLYAHLGWEEGVIYNNICTARYGKSVILFVDSIYRRLDIALSILRVVV